MVASLIVLIPAAVAGFAGATVRRARLREERAEAESPPRGMLIKARGDFGAVTIHAEIAGEGPDLILIHGASGNAREFTFRLTDRLKSRYRVIAFDRPGLGWSGDMGAAGNSPQGQVAALRAAAARLGVHRPVVLGQSYGGAVAMAWALAAPEEVAALVIVSGATHPWHGGLGLWYRLMRSWTGRNVVVPIVTAWAGRRRAKRVIEAIFAPQKMPRGYLDHIGIGLILRRETLRINARQVNALLRHVTDLAPRYARLKMPIEIVHGTADSIVPIGIHAERMVRQVPGANLTRLEGVGHMPHHTHPDEVIAAIHRASARAGTR
ncbi:alpha/beta fold hydrolase [Acidimangrovimonas sediminis]|uniref:alpha/beta fold hydrolase n=1 Tax=Acidimangrovimonas sediminis TaxID=2056283 RepID=UPI001E28EA4C|nr:alpha/beta hydrolase [Acidimangrovimonas sediminis]